MNLFVFLAALFLISFPVQAEEVEFDVDVDTVLICDKAAQVKRFITLFEGDVDSALRTVNAEEPDPAACDVATIAYVFVGDVAKAKGPCGQFRVVEIVLIAVLTEEQGFRFTVPATHFTMAPPERESDRMAQRRVGDLRNLVALNQITPECRVASSNEGRG